MVIEETSEAGVTPKHVFVNENGPWNWTCDSCGYTVKAGSRLDHQISKVQRRRRIWRDALAALGLRELLGAGTADSASSGGGLAASSATARGGVKPTPAQAAVASIGVVAAVAVLAVVARAPAPAPRSAGAAGGQSVAQCERDVATVTRAIDATALAGRCVQLDGAPVHSVTGDVTFWVGTSDQDRAFVVLNERTQGERAVTVRPGQSRRTARGLAASAAATTRRRRGGSDRIRAKTTHC
jgi:hypothetical protein